MNIHILDAPGELFLGSDAATAFAQGPRQFRSAAKAVRFAMEQAAPVSLRGALLKVGDVTLGPRQIRRLHKGLVTVSRPGRKARNAQSPATKAVHSPLSLITIRQ